MTSAGPRDQDAPPVLLVAPVSGRVVPLALVPDEVFAQEIVGPGCAVEPRVRGQEADGIVRSPLAGTVATLFPHAFAVEDEHGRTVLVHLGIDTVTLKGEGFTTLVTVGDTVSAGQPVLLWEPDVVAAAGLATVCPVVLLQGDAQAVTVLVDEGTLVQAGDGLMVWAG